MSAKNHEDNAISLLAAGLTQAQVANALGLAPSAVNSMVQRPEFLQAVKAAELAKYSDHVEADDLADAIEKRAGEKLQDRLQYETDTLKLATVYKIANGAKRKTIPVVTPTPTTTNNFILLQLPTKVKQKFVTSPRNELVQVGDEPLASATQAQLMNLTQEAAEIVKSELVEKTHSVTELLPRRG